MGKINIVQHVKWVIVSKSHSCYFFQVPYEGPLIWVILLVLGTGFCGMTLGMIFDMGDITSVRKRILWETLGRICDMGDITSVRKRILKNDIR